MQAGAITVPPPEPSMLLDPTELLLALRLEPTLRIHFAARPPTSASLPHSSAPLPLAPLSLSFLSAPLHTLQPLFRKPPAPFRPTSRTLSPSPRTLPAPFRLSRGVPLAKMEFAMFNLHNSMFENPFR